MSKLPPYHSIKTDPPNSRPATLGSPDRNEVERIAQIIPPPHLQIHLQGQACLLEAILCLLCFASSPLILFLSPSSNKISLLKGNENS